MQKKQSKVFNFFAVVLYSFSLYIAGVSFADNQVADGVLNLIMAALWGSILLISVASLCERVKLAGRLDNLVREAFKDIERIMRDERARKSAPKRSTEGFKQQTTPPKQRKSGGKKSGVGSANGVKNIKVRSKSEGKKS